MIVYDDVLDPDELNDIVHFFEKVEWKYGEKSIKYMWTETLPHWTKYFYLAPENEGVPKNEVFFSDPCINSLYSKIKELVSPGANLLRCYANGHTYGDDANIHYDDSRTDTTTFIFYPMKEWNVDWGGSTIFWDRVNREIVKSVVPKPNRFVVFDSKIWHGASALTRYCKKLRITLMFKFKG